MGSAVKPGHKSLMQMWTSWPQVADTEAKEGLCRSQLLASPTHGLWGPGFSSQDLFCVPYPSPGLPHTCADLRVLK